VTLRLERAEAIVVDPEVMGDLVEEGVLDEIAHHFGIDDDRLRALKSERHRR